MSQSKSYITILINTIIVDSATFNFAFEGESNSLFNDFQNFAFFRKVSSAPPGVSPAPSERPGSLALLDHKDQIYTHTASSGRLSRSRKRIGVTGEQFDNIAAQVHVRMVPILKTCTIATNMYWLIHTTALFRHRTTDTHHRRFGQNSATFQPHRHWHRLWIRLVHLK